MYAECLGWFSITLVTTSTCYESWACFHTLGELKKIRSRDSGGPSLRSYIVGPEKLVLLRNESPMTNLLEAIHYLSECDLLVLSPVTDFW
jgi:hypothetical protein